MAYVSGKQGEGISRLMDEADSLFANGDTAQSLAKFESAWEALPDDKYQYDESFLIVWSILAIALKINDVFTMNKWVEHIFHADPGRADCGEREMWGARVAIASGYADKAFDYLDIAVKKSKGRCFEKGDSDLKKAYLKARR